MARKYDIAQKIANANQKPMVRIDEENEFEINNGKSVVIMAQAIIDEDGGNIESLDKVIKMALGDKASEYINSLDLTLPAYQLIVEAIVAGFSDSDLEEVEARVNEKKK